ncbi:hypothetical protein BIV57_10695 [Mangrovactinospora gilvigrisea]|uniref:Major facilitator superfamily (MFS) profile domain-containing protein n=1 Tax=Mangrovactinospora gilvigrisea TaxID=1428644 RepID=A0A1J7C7I9_9ACTN|nr:MFS transporter [Mangrovactinospora gilvigrisea]OIV37500.1 hypothetical protein BIV57_10695 [Mangrovactinospora gilvigrisea]
MPVLPRTAAFWVVGAVLTALMAAAGAPSPLYVVYQARWGFSEITLTAVFGVYAVALLVALLTVGALSDHIGRRPVLIGALLAEAVAMGLFIAADNVGWLYAARALQGLATGAATSALAASLIDHQPAARPHLAGLVNGSAPTLGLGVGAVGAGLLVQYAPAPTVLVYALLAAVFLIAAVVVAGIPETSPRRPGALASLAPRAGVPASARRAFWTAAPALVAVWAVGGFYLSLGPSIAAGVLHLTNHLVGGLVVAALTFAGAAAAAGASGRPARTVMGGGAVTLAAGLAVTLAGVETGAVPLFFLGTVVAGFGFGAGFLGALRTITARAGAGERASLLATMYMLSYAAFAAPAVGAGAAVPSVGLTGVTLWYGVGAGVLALAVPVLALAAPSPRHPARTASPPEGVEAAVTEGASSPGA